MLRVNEDNRDRMRSAAGVALLHALLGYALVRGLGFDAIAPEREVMQLFDVLEEPPPPLAEPPPPEKVQESKKAKPKDAEGAAAPPNLKDTPTQIVVPPPKIVVPTPIPAAPVAGLGNAPKAGAAEIPGPGTGRGGVGTGLGSGTQGTGTGGGGGGIGRPSRARHISGSLGPDDYPPRAFDRRVQGIVYLRFTVMPSGRVRDCTVTRSSGSSELDSTTCRLIERRFRYRPARDAEGRAIAETIRGEHHWEIGPEPPPTYVEPEEEP